MQCRILGGLEVEGPGGIVRALSPRQQVVLAMLLLEANHVVPIDRLVDAVWDDSPPSSARAQIQICVSAVRRAFADVGAGDPIVTRSPGYLIRTTDREFDLYEFERLSNAGRAAVAAR